ncbi:MAG TPA: Ger(x)C family spore germination protein [Bacilli bacterium]
MRPNNDSRQKGGGLKGWKRIRTIHAKNVLPRKPVAFLLLAFLPAILSGCWDRTEINDIAIVMATGIDLAGDNTYRVSVQVALPGQMGGQTGGGGGTSGNKSYYVDSDTGKTMREAVNKIQSRMSRKLFFSHRRVFVVSEQLARKKGIVPLFDEVSRMPENRLTSYLVVSAGKAYELLNIQPKFERFSGEAIREIAKAKSVIPLNLKAIAQSISLNGSDAIAVYMELKKPQKAEEPSPEIEFAGYAQFREGKMVGLWQHDKANGLQWLLSKPQMQTVTMEGVKKEGLTLVMRRGSSTVNPIIVGGHVHLDVRVKAEADVLEDWNNEDLSDPQSIQSLERDFAKMIRKNIETAFSEMIREKVDSAAIGQRISRKYPRIWQENLAPKWDEAFAQTTLSVSAAVKIRSVGLVTNNIAEKERPT